MNEDWIYLELLRRRKQVRELKKENENYLKLTRELDEHPEWFEYACECNTCLSYADNDFDD